MNTAQRIAKNAGVLLFSKVVSRLLAFFYIMYTARYLGAKGFGILSFALAFAGIFGILTDLGLEQLTIREVARAPALAGKYFANVLFMKGLLVTAAFGIMALVINLLGYPRQAIQVVYIIGLSVVVNAFTHLFYAIFQAFEAMEFVSLGQILESVLMFAGVLLAIRGRFQVVGFALVFLGTSGMVLGYGIAILKRKFSDLLSLKRGVDGSFWKPTMKEALPFGLSAIFVTVYFWVDSVMLSLMKGNETVGWYNAAYRLIFGLMLIPSVSVASIFPVMSRHFKTAKHLLVKEYEIVFRYLFITALFLWVFGFMFAGKVIAVIYGMDYLPSIAALRVLIWVIPVIFLTFLFGNFLAAVDKQKVVTGVAGANAGLNILLNLLLIPRFSYVGASVATVLTEVLGLVLMGRYISRNYLSNSISRSILKPACCVGITAVALYLLRHRVHWIIAGVLGGMVYVFFLLLFRVISREDVNLLKHEVLGLGSPRVPRVS